MINYDLMWKVALSRDFDVAERYFDVALQQIYMYLFFVKIPFRPRIVLSRLFVSKISVTSSVCVRS